MYQLEAIKKIKTHFFLYFYGSHNLYDHALPVLFVAC